MWVRARAASSKRTASSVPAFGDESINWHGHTVWPDSSVARVRHSMRGVQGSSPGRFKGAFSFS